MRSSPKNIMRSSPICRALCVLSSAVNVRAGTTSTVDFTTWHMMGPSSSSIMPKINSLKLIGDHQLYEHSLKQWEKAEQRTTKQETTVVINHLFDATKSGPPEMIGHCCWQTLHHTDAVKTIGLPGDFENYLDFLRPQPLAILHTFSIYPEFQRHGYFPFLWAHTMDALKRGNIQQVAVCPTSPLLQAMYQRKLTAAGYSKAGLFMLHPDPEQFILDLPPVLLAKTPS